MSTWRERLNQAPYLNDISRWPPIDITKYSRAKKKKILERQHWVHSVLSGTPIIKVAERAGVSPSTVSKLMERCLGGDLEMSPILSQGFIPNSYAHGYSRHADLPSLTTKKGYSGSFQFLLDQCEGLRDHLDNLIKQSNGNSLVRINLTPTLFYDALVDFLTKSGWPHNSYPFTSVDMGRESCRLYFHSRQSYIRNKKSRRDSVRSLGNSFIYQDIEIDEHLLDSTSNIQLQWDIASGTSVYPLRLSRFTLILARCRTSKAILAPWFVFDRHISQGDFRQALQHFFKPGELPALSTNGLKYKDGAGFPTTENPDWGDIPIPHIIHMDNSMVHLSHSILDFITKELNVSLHLSRPGRPLARQIIEAAFGLIEKQIHALPNSVGKNVLDPRRESKRQLKHPPVVSVQALIEAIRMITANYNATVQASLHGATPLQVIRHQLDQYPILKMSRFRSWHAFNPKRTEKLVVHFPSNDAQQGYVNYCYMKMRGPGLRDHLLRGKSVIALIDENDLRKFEIFTEDGKPLGWVSSPPSWQSVPYSHSMLRQMHRHVRSQRNSESISLLDYLNFLIENRNKPKYALLLVKCLARQVNEPEGPFWKNDQLMADKGIQRVKTLKGPEIESIKPKRLPSWSPKIRKRKGWFDEDSNKFNDD